MCLMEGIRLKQVCFRESVMIKKLRAIVMGMVLSSQLILAQVNSGTISGLVRDDSEAVIPGATVTIRNIDTGISRTVITDDQGRYRASNVALGNYEVQAAQTGFQKEVRTGVGVAVGQEAVVNLTLRVGDVTQSVEVRSEALAVDTTSAAITGLVDDKTIRDLPLNGRSFDQLVLLQVGTVQFRRSPTGVNNFNGGGSKVSISGARPQQNSFLLDGTDVNDYRNTMPGSVAGVFLGVETVREFRVLTNSYGAEYGRAAGGVITAVTRSGTNNLHGSAFDFLRNSALDARNFFDLKEAKPFKRNQFGFTIGGPVRKDRTFFFGSYEGLRDRLGITAIGSVPDELARQGIIPRGGQLVNVGVAPGVAPWLALFPLPNGRNFGDGTAQHISGASQPTNDNFYTGRVDHTFSEKHSFFARYTIDDATQDLPSPLPIYKILNGSRNQYLTVEADSILSQSTLNAFRFGYNRAHISAQNVLPGFPAGLYLVPGIPFTNGGSLAVTGLDNIGNQQYPADGKYNLFEWSDDVTRTWGRHTLKAGIIFKRIRTFRVLSNGNGGYYNNTGGLTSLLQGQSTSYIQQLPCCPLDRDYRQNLLGFYGQDDFKVTPRLTFNLGVREEFMTPPSEVHNKASNLPNVMATSPLIQNPFFQTHKVNLAPRIGFAWDSRGNGKMVVRGGFGIFYDQPIPNYWISSTYSMPPFAQLVQLANVPFPTAYTLVDPQHPTLGDLRPFDYSGTTSAMQYDFTIQSQVTPSTALTVGYAGSQGRHLVLSGQQNIKIPVIVNGQQFFPANASRRNPVWGNTRFESTKGTSNYNALVVSVNKSLRGGLQLGGSYNYAKIMSEGETVFSADGVGAEQQLMDPFDPGRDRSAAPYSEKHNLIINYSYSLPNIGKGVIGKVADGWQLNGITRISSGAPFSAISSCCSGNGSTGNAVMERPNLVAGRSSNPILGKPNGYFDVTAFENAPAGFYGNLGRNTLVGPGLVNFDFSLVKNTPITERLHLEFRAELFNIFNHANFSTPPNSLFTATGARVGSAAVITKTDTSSRQIQFALKLAF